MDVNDNLVSTGTFLSGGGGVVDIETDPATGDLYYIDINTSTIQHVRYAPGEPAPNVVASVTPTAGFAPLTVTATASGSNDPDGDTLSFVWTFGDGGTSHQADTTYTYTAQGSYLATVVVNDGHGGIGSQSFPIVVGQVAPPGTIVQPLTRSFFYQNQPLSLQASPVDTSVTPATYRWDVDFGHNNHIHPSESVYFGQFASYTPESPNEGNMYYFRIRLTVTQGLLSTSDTVFIYPRVNLVATQLAFDPPSPGPLAPFAVSAKLFSTGEVGSPPVPFQVLEGATVLATGTIGPILQGDSLVVSTLVGPLAFGPHVLRFVADPTDSLAELNETDNQPQATATVSGLIAGYGIDLGSGTNLADMSGHGINGTITGATWVNPGKYGRALSFNGSTNYVNLGNPALMATSGSMTWSAWVRPSTTPADDGIILGRSDSGTGWQLKTSPDTGPRRFAVAVSGALNEHTQRYGTITPVLNTWYHVAGVYDAAALTLDLYVNGALDNGTLAGTVPSSQYDPALAASIGRRSGGFYFGGQIDEVRIYNRALTPAEIQADMNTPLASGAVEVPGSAPALPAGFSFAVGGANPFRDRATLAYALPHAAHVRMQVFDIAGHLVSTLEDGLRPAGRHTATFEPKRLASGLYFCRIEASGFTSSRKLFLLR
jgi:hypothetical protein